MIDIHCHLLPGLDDGPRSMDDTLAMLRMAAADGVTTIVATPHYGGRFGEPKPDTIRDLVAQVNRRAREAALAIEVLPGCEACLELDLAEKVERGQVLTFGETNRYVLVEVATEPLPLYALDVSFRLRTLGVTPVLAHGERLAATNSGWGFVRRFKEQGGLVQLNADAVAGQAGWRVKRVCRGLLAENLATVIASDGHSPDWRPPLLSPCLHGFPKRVRPTVLETYCELPGLSIGR